MDAKLIQGTPEWHSLRKTKITATDAAVIMGISPWKTRSQLYHEKLSDAPPPPSTERMKRGIDLEPIAREVFTEMTRISVDPAVVVKDWAMASLDGMDLFGNCIVEIKCPGEKDHSLAKNGKIPEYYYPQLQHQMYVTDLDSVIYFSFDGSEGVIVEVERNEKYIEEMVKKEMEFYECLINKVPPEPQENEYTERSDDLWATLVSRWKAVAESLKDLEAQEKELREDLIFLSGESNVRGAGISLCKVSRKGAVDYSKIPELKGVDLDKYRKETASSWRIISN